MNFHLNDWLSLLLRLAHLVAGISWIGSSFYFIWLDSHLEKPKSLKTDVEGELWMVHSGGFYLVERKKIGPGSMPETLHWFKYEALFTWLTGIFLLGVVYYFTGGAFLVDPAVLSIQPIHAVLVSLGILTGSWLIYDFLWQTLGKKHPQWTSGICLGLLGVAAFTFTHLLSGRAAFIHMGALLGTLMVANVWIRILPAQQKMVDATAEGRLPDYALSGHAKRRSVHNSYMTFPVLFMMLSNHYPMVYGQAHNWLILILLMISGASMRHMMISKSASGRKWAIAPVAASLLTLVFLASSVGVAEAPRGMASLNPVTFLQVRQVITQRCVRCHSTHPEETTFGPSPGGVSFEAPEQIRAFANRIKFRVVETKTMPLANKTEITDDERALLGRWVDQGAQVQ